MLDFRIDTSKTCKIYEYCLSISNLGNKVISMFDQNFNDFNELREISKTLEKPEMDDKRTTLS